MNKLLKLHYIQVMPLPQGYFYFSLHHVKGLHVSVKESRRREILKKKKYSLFRFEVYIVI